MAVSARSLRRAATKALALLGVLTILASLILLSMTTQNSDQFGRLQLVILLLNAVGVIVLLILIVGNLFRIVGEYRRHVAGARLKSRLVAIFTLLAVLPVLVVYAFSLQFITRGIDSWFDVEVERGLDEALSVSRTSLEIRMREYLEHTGDMARELAGRSDADLVQALGVLRADSDAAEMTVFAQNSRIVATSSEFSRSVVPDRPSDEVLLQVRSGRPYVGLDPLAEGEIRIRTATELPVRSAFDEPRMLYVIYPVPERMSYLAESVQAAYSQYRELAFLRQPLKASFVLTLTLVLLLSVLAAVWGAFFSARRLVAPIQNLVAGTRAVAKGDFDTRLPVTARDDIGFLVNSFNEMTRRLANAREQALSSQQQVESERANLEAILARLSTGVIALEPDLAIRNVNEAADAILGSNLGASIGRPLPALSRDNAMLDQFLHVYERHFNQGDIEWREQVVLRGEAGRRVLTCACTALPGDDGQPGGYVVVFDDITELLQAQRDAAWGEVARRLAHEIKNPLTPIQLSAERLRRRYLNTMNEADAHVLERATRTIVQQVESMKAMVDAFRDYARAPSMEFSLFDLNGLISEVTELYKVTETGPAPALDLDESLPRIEADAGRIRQIVHNLLANAVEALHGRSDAKVGIRTRASMQGERRLAEITVSDNGPGFEGEALGQIFDPYVTSKPKGTGLGLAIVKKIVEEHGGHIEADNRREGGARVTIVLPVDEASRAAPAPRVARNT